MTSSLVGSEMCIRDRHTETCCPALEVAGARFALFSWAGQHGGASRGAVSYTHLTLPTICSV
eukprot:3532012-Prorocentrum_lima.AAC.1